MLILMFSPAGHLRFFKFLSANDGPKHRERPAHRAVNPFRPK